MRIKKTKPKILISKEFAMVNSWINWIAIIFMVAVSLYVLSYLKTDFHEALMIMKKESKGVVMLDALGRPVLTKKIPMDITSDAFKKVILNNIQTYFVWDWTSLTDNYQNKILNVNDLERFNPKFKEFRIYFIPKNDKKAQKEFLSFEKYIVYSILNDKMPESISISNADVSFYHTKKDKFETKIIFNLIANVYNTVSGNYERRVGNMSVEAEGYFDSSAGSIMNPLGLNYSTIKTNLLTKN